MPSATPYRYHICFIAITLASYGCLAIWPTFMTILGVGHGGYWFLDINTLLASNDAVSLGLDPYQPNPLDVLRDSHAYSSWWLQLRHLGLGRPDRLWLGILINLLFFACAFWQVRPRNFREFLISWLLLASPPLILGFNRANADLLIYATLVPVSWLLLNPRPSLQALGAGLIAFSIGLKYYPVAACLLIFLTATNRRDLLRQIVLLVILGALLAINLWSDLHRNVTHPTVVNQYYTFGAATLGTNLGQPVLVATLGSLLSLLAVTYGWHRPCLPIPSAVNRRALAEFFLGSSLLILCFFLTVNYAYRLVFILLLVPYLISCLRSPHPRERRYGSVTVNLSLALVWSDGLMIMNGRLLEEYLAPESLGKMHQVFVCLAHGLAWIWLLVILVGFGSIVRTIHDRWSLGDAQSMA